MLHNQAALPKLPIPTLEQTCSRYLAYVEPLLPAEQFANTKKAVESFRTKEGIELQRQLQVCVKFHFYNSNLCDKVYDRGVTSYIKSFWDDAYLIPRDPIAINVNPYLLLQEPPGARSSQAARAGSLLSATGEFVQKIRTRTLEPDVEKVPLDMSQYDHLMCTTRIPHVRRDTLTKASNAHHVAVLCRNRLFKLDILASDGSALPSAQLTKAIEEIIARANTLPLGPAVGALTAEHRSHWALIRPLLGDQALKAIDDSIIVLCLDAPQSDDMQHVVKQMLHSDCHNRWFDKTVQLIVSHDGRAAVNLEHSGCDGHTLLRYVIEISESARANKACGNGIAAWSAIEFNTGDADVVEGIRRAEQHAAELVAHNRSELVSWDNYGKQFLKSQKISPDAALQMAFQLAYWRHSKTTPSTYESCMTKHVRVSRMNILLIILVSSWTN